MTLPPGRSVREAGGEDCDDPTGEGGQGFPGKEDIAVHAHAGRAGGVSEVRSGGVYGFCGEGGRQRDEEGCAVDICAEEWIRV